MKAGQRGVTRNRKTEQGDRMRGDIIKLLRKYPFPLPRVIIGKLLGIQRGGNSTNGVNMLLVSLTQLYDTLAETDNSLLFLADSVDPTYLKAAELMTAKTEFINKWEEALKKITDPEPVPLIRAGREYTTRLVKWKRRRADLYIERYAYKKIAQIGKILEAKGLLYVGWQNYASEQVRSYKVEKRSIV